MEREVGWNGKMGGNEEQKRLQKTVVNIQNKRTQTNGGIENSQSSSKELMNGKSRAQSAKGKIGNKTKESRTGARNEKATWMSTEQTISR